MRDRGSLDVRLLMTGDSITSDRNLYDRAPQKNKILISARPNHNLHGNCILRDFHSLGWTTWRASLLAGAPSVPAIGSATSFHVIRMRAHKSPHSHSCHDYRIAPQASAIESGR